MNAQLLADIFPGCSGREAIRFEIPRQRLMLKLVDGQPQSAWHFYPRPEKVWVHRLLKTGSDLQLARAAFEVAPPKDSVASLAVAVREKLGIMSLESVEIHLFNYAGKWEWIRETEQVRDANTKATAYGYYLLE